jgi:hypothetical protein
MPRRLLQDKLVQKLPKLEEYSERSIKTWSSMNYRPSELEAVLTNLQNTVWNVPKPRQGCDR